MSSFPTETSHFWNSKFYMNHGSTDFLLVWAKRIWKMGDFFSFCLLTPDFEPLDYRATVSQIWNNSFRAYLNGFSTLYETRLEVSWKLEPRDKKLWKFWAGKALLNWQIIVTIIFQKLWSWAAAPFPSLLEYTQPNFPYLEKRTIRNKIEKKKKEWLWCR